MKITSVVLIIVSISTIISNSFAIQCFKKNSIYKKNNARIYRFTISHLIICILALFLSCIGMYYGF